jgi:hypothetical protein
MKFLFNFLGYEAVWFAAVIGAGRGFWWPSVVAAAIFAISHTAIVARTPAERSVDLRLLAVALALGVAVDGGLAWSGSIDYAADVPALPPGGAPLWILAMWAAFALTLRHSLGVFMRKPQLALLVGAVFGPLAYLGAGRGWNAATFAEPIWQPIAFLAIGWGASMLALALLAGRWSSSLDKPAAAGLRGGA